MLNYIWIGMLIGGIITGIINGRIDEVTKAIMTSSQNAIELSIGLLGVMCLWTGLMGIAEKSGIIKGIAKILRPVIKLLFPDVPKDHPATGAIVMNLVANFLGLGNAATPLGLKAMNELQKLNKKKDTATDSMSTFLVLNTSCIQFIPATIIAVRSATGSQNPTEVIGTIWIATICATTAGVIAAKLFSLAYAKKAC
ncbi:UNVERIFIED_CONTAM: spore maturation protein A [Acetivibrio alkalicellulosi]